MFFFCFFRTVCPLLVNYNTTVLPSSCSRCNFKLHKFKFFPIQRLRYNLIDKSYKEPLPRSMYRFCSWFLYSLGPHLLKFFWARELVYISSYSIFTGFVWITNMVTVSSFWITNMATVTSYENALLYQITIWKTEGCARNRSRCLIYLPQTSSLFQSFRTAPDCEHTCLNALNNLVCLV